MLKGSELADVSKGIGQEIQALIEKKQKFIARGIPHSNPIAVDEAKGAVIKDIYGNIYIDFYGGIGVINAGHCPDTVVEAIKNQAGKFIHTFFSTAMYSSMVDLAEKLVQIAPGDFDKKAMFVNTGAEAVENAIKIAKAYTKKQGVIAFEYAFHGRTLLTMTLTSKVKPYKYGFGPFAPEVYKVPSAYCYRCPYKSTYPECGLHCLDYLNQFFSTTVDPGEVAAMIIEPVQGEGGFIVPPPEFLPGLKKICEENNIVFIADEVQTGFGRTGKMFAVENFGVEPDIITMAKSIAAGMPLSAVVGKAEIMDAPGPGYVGGTYSGNPLSCAAALATIDLLQGQDLSERANNIGKKTVGRLKELQEKHPQIGDIRSLGAMVGVEIVKDPVTKEPAPEEKGRIIDECFQRGLIIIGAGVFSNVIRMLMPLVITDEQLDQALAILEESCEVVLGK